jgi:hypothetical protein
MGSEGEDAHRATCFCSLAGIIGGNSQVLGKKFPLTGLHKTLNVQTDRTCTQLNARVRWGKSGTKSVNLEYLRH